MTDFFERSLIIHEQLHGKIGVVGKMPIANRDDLSLAYTPGVARPCEVIAREPGKARELTIKRNSVAVVTDGSAVLGLGNIGPYAAIPVMEGKALLFKEFANIDAWPICLDTQDVDEIVATVRRIAPVFGGINLEDISAPRCFAIERQLQDIGIPVFHDDQHGTAIVLLAALINAAKVLNRDITKMKVVINGAGAAGTAIARLLRCVGQTHRSREAPAHAHHGDAFTISNQVGSELCRQVSGRQIQENPMLKKTYAYYLATDRHVSYRSRNIFAIALQSELRLTDIVGWCQVYW